MKISRILVVDDSALVRSLLADAINGQRDMECVGTADDALLARDLIRAFKPDVVVLDLEMPRMDSNDFLARLLRRRPMPVVALASPTEHGADLTLRALEIGAIDYVVRPHVGAVDGLSGLALRMVEKLRIVARARLLSSAQRYPSPLAPEALALGRAPGEELIFVGASTGGVEAIRQLLSALPIDAPGVLVAVHMPAIFTRVFASWLNAQCRIAVREAVEGDVIAPGHAYVAPGGWQLRLARNGTNYVAELEQFGPEQTGTTGVDALFRSAASVAGKNAIGIMLTGEGSDGALAMREMKNAGGYNFVQDQASCVVFGMPGEAIALGAAHQVLPLTAIAAALLERLRVM